MELLLADATLEGGGGRGGDEWRTTEASALDSDPSRKGRGYGPGEDRGGRVLPRAEGDGRVLVLDLSQGF